MLSILIPTYNYNVYPLVKELDRQSSLLNIPYEIIVVNDASTIFNEENKGLSDIENVNYIIQKENLGRTKVRDILTKNATYNWLLFMDADVQPKSDTFVKKMVTSIQTLKFQCAFGGVSYREELPHNDYLLRWYYGRRREQLSLSKRQKNPYHTINSGCFLIDRKVFLSINEKLASIHRYGLDLYFKYLLKQEGIILTHIENEVFHLGLETSSQFFKKSLQAVETLFFLEKNKYIPQNEYPIQKMYLTIKKYHLLRIIRWVFSVSKGLIEKNMRTSKPNLKAFDFYRLGYFIALKND